MPPQPKLVVVHASGQYPIFIDQDWWGELAGAVASACPRSLVISDDTVADLYAGDFCDRLRESGQDIRLVTVPPGESSKTLLVAGDLYQKLLSAGVDRQSTIIALGGGVVGDLAGFVAATWMRGIDFVQIPTTLLAQVDSSVGGKTGVNLPGAKNVIGAYWQPRAVFIDTAVLKTLSDVEFTSGLAEVVKYAVILDPGLFDLLENHVQPIRQRDPQTLVDLVQRCCQLKARVVARDERETTGHRAILNYGHTFGHAVESVFGYGTVPHGHAVAMGMSAAARLACSLGWVDEQFVRRQSELLDALQIPSRFPADRHAEMMEVMRSDKKAVAGRPRFVLPVRMGAVELTDQVEPEQVVQAMRQSAGGPR